MLESQNRRAHVLVPLVFAVVAACTDTNPVTPLPGDTPRFAQGVNGVWTVNLLVDVGDGICDDTHCSIRDAIHAASAGHQVVFDPSLQGVLPLELGSLVIDKSLSVDGAGRITIDAQGFSRVLTLPNNLATPTVVVLDGLTFTGGSSGAIGGGIFVGALTTLTIRNSTISDNSTVDEGGGLYIWSSATVSITNSTIAGNQADVDGAGIWSAGALTLQNSTVNRNFADRHGGGVFVASGTADIRNTTISGNIALLGGGGVSNGNASGAPSPAGGMLTIASVNIARNSFGIAHGGSGGNRTMVANSIVAGNGNGDCSSPSNGLTSLGHNLSSSCQSFFTAAGDRNVLQGQIFTQVMEFDMQANGGPTLTHALIARGLAVDAGYCPGETADQRGFARPVDDPTLPDARDACDIGPYEAQGPVVAVADLMISQAVDKNSVKQGELLTYTVRVQNLGPQDAPNVVVNNVLSSGVTFVEARVNKGTTTAPPKGETGTVTWTLGDLANQGNEHAEIMVTVLVKGRTTVTNTASVTGDVSDPNDANNSASITVSVGAGKTGPPKKG